MNWLLFVGYLMYVDVLMYNDVLLVFKFFILKKIKNCLVLINVFWMLYNLNKKILISNVGRGRGIVFLLWNIFFICS